MVDDSGHLSVIDWTGGAAGDPHIVSVRRNLPLIVDHGSIAASCTRMTTAGGDQPGGVSYLGAVPADSEGAACTTHHSPQPLSGGHFQ